MTSNEQFLGSLEDYAINIHGVRLPSITIPAEDKKNLGLSEDCDNFEFLRALCKNGFKKLTFEKNSKEIYGARVKMELDAVKELGFVDYFLLVWDVINYCRKNGIPVGRGRGSGAGSLVLYLIGVTGVDPIKFGLLFERFISKTRAKKQVVDGVTYLDGSLMCDVDLDIDYYRRDDVIKYVEAKFNGKASKILTFSTLTGKALIKECGKVVANFSEDQMKPIAGMIPSLQGFVTDISDVYKENENFKKWCDNNARLYKIALKLRNLIKGKGSHASGISIPYGGVTDITPYELSANEDTGEKETVTSFDMEWIGKINVKLDLLGLKTLSLVDRVCKSVGEVYENIDFENPFIYQQLQDIKTSHGVFQIEKEVSLRTCQKVKPKNIHELAAVMALPRPGAFQFIDQYATFSNTGVLTSLHPFLDKVLGNTGGVCLYQEQIMKIIHEMGFSLLDAEEVRRCVGKKDQKKIQDWKDKIYSKCEENKLGKELADIVWKIVEDAGKYSFNASHGYAYSSLTAVCIYLKYKYPRQFFLELLNMTKEDAKKIEQINLISRELSLFGIKMLPADLLKSSMNFTLENNNIRYGLGFIKNVSEAAMKKLSEFKHEFLNKIDIYESAKQIGLNIGALSSLIQAGAIEKCRDNRSRCVYEAQVWNKLTQKEKKHALLISEECGNDVFAIVKKMATMKDAKGKTIMRESRVNTLKAAIQPYAAIYQQNSKSEDFANWYYEQKLAGHSFGISLRDIFAEKTGGLMPISVVCEAEENEDVKFIGTIVLKKSGVAKNAKQTRYLNYTITDEANQIGAVIFNEKIEFCEAMNNGLPKEGNIVIVTGRKKGDSVFADCVAMQDLKIYIKLADLKS